MLKKDPVRLREFLEIVPTDYRHAVEFRHPSWYDEEIFDILRQHKAAHVALSSGGMPMNLSVTTDFIYIRFHGLAGGAAHNYTVPELEPWADFIMREAERGRTVYAYFNNDINVRAPDNARTLMEMVREVAVSPNAQEHPRFQIDPLGARPRSARLASR
jgi:uncharacterized protein YecE (DUF72 family)